MPQPWEWGILLELIGFPMFEIEGLLLIFGKGWRGRALGLRDPVRADHAAATIPERFRMGTMLESSSC